VQKIKKRGLLAGAAMALAMPLSITTAHAQAAASQARDFNIPAQDLPAALAAFGEQAGVQFTVDRGSLAGKRSAAVSGRLTPQEALARLLAGTGLSFNFLNANTVSIEVASDGATGERVLGAVRVEGETGSPYFGGAGRAAGVNGINGSRDITATEGTGSFTSGALTVGSKVPQALKDVAQSISVLTSERLEQQNVTDFTSAMRQLPGVTLVQGGSSLESTFYSRGHPITSIQVDGGSPLTTMKGYFTQIDMSVYDHVELLRGAAGVFGGYGEPGGVVNLVRKKPLDHPQYVLDAQAGSWSNYRVSADASSPLALDGKLRGRLVMTYQNNRQFYHTAKDKKTLIYGIVDMDVSPSTVVSAGLNYTEQASIPWYYGLPRYMTGEDLKLPRSTCLCASWNRQNFETTEIFGTVEQKIGNNWFLKVNFNHNKQSSEAKVGNSIAAVNDDNHKGPVFRTVYSDFASDQFSIETILAGSFEIFGQRQEITLGVNRTHSDGGDTYSYPSPDVWPFPPVDVFSFNPNNSLYSEPRNPLPTNHNIEDATNQTVAYIKAKLTAFDRPHLETGLRWNRYVSKYLTEDLCTVTNVPGDTNCFGKSIGYAYGRNGYTRTTSAFSWPPTVTLSFDLKRNLTAYLSYTDIYNDQSSVVSSDLTPMGPVTGANFEGGLKWSPKDGRLNATISFYKVRRNGVAVFGGQYYPVSPGVICCFLKDANQSMVTNGIDLDVTGEVLPGLQVSANYTYSNTRKEGSSYGSDQGKTFLSIQPKALYKLWTTYDFGRAGVSGPLSGLAVSLGVNGQSSAYQSGYVCPEFAGNPDPVTGYQDCAVDTVPYSFIVPAYAVFSGRIDYRISKNWSLAVNLENILDKTYYQTVSDSLDSGHWYGAPRSVTASLRAKW
jgi:outer-membrane receptor for ferric coprogen and ferric-rhodotorulic acid